MKPVEFVELPGFIKSARELFSDDDLRGLQNALLENPGLGEVIPGAGGMRKMRWAAKGKGRRGGARIIYFFRASRQRLFLVVAYTKNVKIDLTAAERKFFTLMLKELT